MLKYKKSLLITLCVILAIVFIGFIFFALVDFNFSNVGGGKIEEYEYKFTNQYKNIEVDEGFANVEIVTVASSQRRVVGYKRGVDQAETMGIWTDIQEDSAKDILKIKSIDNRKWYQKAFADNSDLYLTIYLPNIDYTLIKIKTAGGDIIVGNTIKSETIKLSSSSGDISCKATAHQTLNVLSASGDVELYGKGADTVMGDVNVKNDSGDVEFNNFYARLINVKTVTGDIEFDEVVEADGLYFETVSGDIEGKIIKNKDIVASSNGRIDIVADAKNGEKIFSIKSKNGDIVIKLSK